ncbi:hypothetical protein N9Z02_02115 [Akkermansiaceae bacterium]|nr:hypothetical protein [Akkermansiaceae bacterium]
MKYPSIFFSCLLLITSSCVLRGAEFVKGYNRFGANQLLEANNSGAGGEVLFVDEAATGGGDLVANAGNPDWGFSVDGSSRWAIGDAVSITGIALPIWANDPDSDNTSNTQNATWRIRFYSAGADGEWDGTGSLASTDDVLIGSVDVEFNSADAGVDEYYAVFDEALDWIVDSPKIWFYCQAVGGKALRLKTGSGGSSVRESRVAGNSLASNSSFSMSLAGTVTSSVPKGLDLSWTPGNGGDNVSAYQEANWTDPVTGETALANSVNPTTPLDRSLRIRTGNPGGGGGAGGDLLLGTGELEIRNATFISSPSLPWKVAKSTSRWRPPPPLLLVRSPMGDSAPSDPCKPSILPSKSPP